MTLRIGPVARLGAGASAVVAILAGALVASAGFAGAAEATVGMGTAGSYAVLAGSTVTNTGPTQVSGDLGVSPGSAVTGFPPGIVSNGSIHRGDAAATNAQADLTVAYNDAAGRSTTRLVVELGGERLEPGVYTGSTLALTGTVTLDALGDPDAVFIFQAGTTLTTAPGATVALVGEASACNVFWQVGSSATLGTDTTFAGTVMALTSIAANTRTTVEGRLLARNGAVTLDSNVITASQCASSPAPGVTSSTTQPATTSTTSSSSTSTTSPTAPVVTLPTFPAAPTSTGTPAPSSAPAVPTGTATGAEPSAATGGAAAGAPAGAVDRDAVAPDAPREATQLATTGAPLGSLSLVALFSLVLGLGLVLRSRVAVPPTAR